MDLVSPLASARYCGGVIVMLWRYCILCSCLIVLVEFAANVIHDGYLGAMRYFHCYLGLAFCGLPNPRSFP